jgi:hypothetical protein
MKAKPTAGLKKQAMDLRVGERVAGYPGRSVCSMDAAAKPPWRGLWRLLEGKPAMRSGTNF